MNNAVTSKLNDPGVHRLSSSDCLKGLKSQSAKQLMTLFKSLEAPTFKDFNGPMQGSLLDSGNFINNFFNKVVTFNPVTGAWQGKQFFVASGDVGSEKGYGYNMFGKKNRRLKFGFNTTIANSQFDGKPTLRMDYVPHPHLLGWVYAYDEIRQIDGNNFLLVAHYTKGPMKISPPIMIHLQRTIVK